ncbi:MAG TPA: efflux transporter outer membrane subunit [Burkholderiales bacterium]|nr:efflux transporter outer membrane subunit [Burkholderiales bacterium]
MRRAVALAALSVLGGCMVGPDYQRPEVPIPATFRYEPQAAQDAETEWWKAFGDPVLDGYIVEALEHNKNLQVAVANVEQAAGILTTTRSPLFPQVGYQGNATRQRFSERGGSLVGGFVENPQTTYQVLAGASWEIDLWGRIRRLTESARANLLATDDARRGVVLSLTASVATTYLQLLGLDEQLEVANRTLETYGQSVKLYELQNKYGQVSKMQVEQARSQYETAAAQIPAIRSQIAQTENALAVLLGRNPGPIARGKKLDALALPAVPAGLPSELLERRPDLMQAEQMLIAANAQIGAAKAQYFPTISLTGALGSASTQLSDLFKGPAGVWSYGGSIVGPIFTGGAIAGQVAQAEAQERAALASYEGAIQNAFADVENALVANVNLGEQLEAQGRLVRALSEYARLARLQFNGGYTSYTTVLQAEQQLFPSELNLASIRAQLYGSLVNLYKALGGGWVDRADGLAPQPMAGSLPAESGSRASPAR